MSNPIVLFSYNPYNTPIQLSDDMLKENFLKIHSVVTAAIKKTIDKDFCIPTTVDLKLVNLCLSDKSNLFWLRESYYAHYVSLLNRAPTWTRSAVPADDIQYVLNISSIDLIKVLGVTVVEIKPFPSAQITKPSDWFETWEKESKKLRFTRSPKPAWLDEFAKWKKGKQENGKKQATSDSGS